MLDLLDADAIRGGWFEGRLQVLGYLYLFTGLRKSEVLNLKRVDVSMEHHYIRLRSRKKKKLKTRPSARFVPIHEELSPVLDRWLARIDGCEWVIPGVRLKVAWTGGSPGKKPLDAIAAVGRRVGIHGLTIQSLRRSIWTHAKRFGLGQLEVQDLLGHGSVRTQDWYLEEDLADARAAIRKIDYRAAIRTV